MTKADWLDFFEAINGRSATEEEIAAALAAGEFQDDAPAQGAPAQPAFANVQEAPVQFKELQINQVLQLLKRLQLKKRNHNQRLLALKKLQFKVPQLNQDLPVLKQPQDKLYRTKRFNLKQVLRMRKLVNKQLLLTVNLFNQVKMFNLLMVKQ